MTAPKPTKASKPRVGRPPSPFENRTMLPRHDAQEEQWRAAAATCGMNLQDWMRHTLDAEAAKATHVPMLKRASH